MLSQKREHAARLQQMPRHRLHIKQIPLILATSLHPTSINATPERTPNRRADYSAVS